MKNEISVCGSDGVNKLNFLSNQTAGEHGEKD